MTWNLIEALTGLVTGDEFGYNGHGKNVVSVKTHYPQNDGRALDWDDIIERGLILLRNPRHAIPSLHNFIYEVQNDLPAHSTRAPLDEWREWRDARFLGQLGAWALFLDHWMEKLKPENRIVITYESLTEEETGPASAKRMSDFLGLDPNVHPIDQGTECIWKAVVKYHETPHIPSIAAAGVDSIEGQYPDPSNMTSYLRHLGKDRQVTDGVRSTNSPKRPLTSYQLEALAQVLPKEKVLAMARESGIEELDESVAAGMHATQLLAPPERRLHRSQDDVTNEQARQFAIRDQERAKEQVGPKLGNHPALPNSFRRGPRDKPYTGVQISSMVEVLAGLRKKFSYDPQIVNILTGYLADVESMKPEELTAKSSLIGQVQTLAS